MKKHLFLALLVYFFSQSLLGQNIVIDESLSAQQLVANVIINSPCATISNVTISGANYASGEKSIAFFDGNSSGFPFANGIVLSTGKAQNTQGPNISLSDDGNNMNWNGDADLEQALGISNTFNATILEFDFVSDATNFSFDYIFSSEEYQGTAPCRYSDGFAFLLKESGSSVYQNLALIPNTSTPVKVTTVHPTIAGNNGCPAENEAYFDAFNGTVHPTNFNGQTKVLTARANITPGTTYHIKLVIADEENYRYDSAIFLGGGSFDFGIDLGIDRLLATENPLCANESLELNAFQNGAIGYQWYKNDTIIPTATSATYTVTEAGTYSVEVTFNANCISEGTIAIEYAPTLVQNETVFTQCDTDEILDGKTEFDLNSIKNQLFTNLPNNYTVSFFETTASAIPLPNIYTNTTANQQVIYARITNINCYIDYPITLNINTFAPIVTDVSVGMCNSNPVWLQADAGFVTYYWNTTPVQTTPNIMVQTPGQYTVTITDANNCTAIKTFTVIVSEKATITDIQIIDFSENNTAIILYSGIGEKEFSLNGYTYQPENVFTNLPVGGYTVYVKDKNNCGIATKNFYILDAPRFFSPNDDGYNDFWYIKNLSFFNKTTVAIYNRLGQLIYQFKESEIGWNGQFKNKKMPADDYWYEVSFENGRKVRGHFSLIR